MITKEIDFSAKHDCLTRSRDGSLRPMDEPYYEVEMIAPGTWMIMSSGDYSYLVEGENEAIAIDTGYGAGNIRAFLQTLTDKPVRNVINTHDHFDHTANNAYFEKAYMSAETAPKATIPFPSFAGIDFPRDYEKVIVDDGDVIDPGARPLLILKIPDHAVGSICMLDRKERILFCGDEFMSAGKNLRVGVRTFYGYMKKIAQYRKDFDRLAGGERVMDAVLADQFLACAEYILEGHEGTTEFPAGKPPAKTQLSDGVIIYDRQMPHPEDFHHDPRPSSMRCMEYAGTRIIYDLNRVNE